MDMKALTTVISGIVADLGTVVDGQTLLHAQLDKVTTEVVTAIGNIGATTPEVDDALARLQAVSDALKTGFQPVQAAVDALDALNTDAPAPAPAPEPAPAPPAGEPAAGDQTPTP